MTNDLQIKSAPAPIMAQPAPRYVSPLDKIATYAELCEAGEMFARSQLVPDTFRGKPGDCAIALDLALRLNLNPLSLFPQLFVIHGRPSLSAQYMIALVNRSGRFSCIRWQEGIDGDVEFTSYGKTRRLPNYYAIAEFTEKATGETLKSTRVDMRVAAANGWLTKEGSKWQTMPAQMCRYRSASWLIKAYAPELAMGLSFVDEVEDFDAVEPYPSVLVAKDDADLALLADDTAPASPFVALENTIQEATDLDALKTAADAVSKAQGLTTTELDDLRRLYAARKKELAEYTAPAVEEPAPVEESAQPAPAQEETPAPVVEETPAKSRRRNKNALAFEAQKPLDTPPASLIGDDQRADETVNNNVEAAAE